MELLLLILNSLAHYATVMMPSHCWKSSRPSWSGNRQVTKFSRVYSSCWSLMTWGVSLVQLCSFLVSLQGVALRHLRCRDGDVEDIAQHLLSFMCQITTRNVHPSLVAATEFALSGLSSSTYEGSHCKEIGS